MAWIMMAEGRLIDMQYHYVKALEEHAAALGKRMEDLEPSDRSEALFHYMLSGRHMGAEERGNGEA